MLKTYWPILFISSVSLPMLSVAGVILVSNNLSPHNLALSIILTLTLLVIWAILYVTKIAKEDQEIIDEFAVTDDEIHKSDYVTHFKFVEDNTLNYVYKVLALDVKHTETDEELVIYQAMYDNKQIYARPKQMFFEEVDKEKYPHSFQTFRFEKITDKKLLNNLKKLM